VTVPSAGSGSDSSDIAGLTAMPPPRRQ